MPVRIRSAVVELAAMTTHPKMSNFAFALAVAKFGAAAGSAKQLRGEHHTKVRALKALASASHLMKKRLMSTRLHVRALSAVPTILGSPQLALSPEAR